MNERTCDFDGESWIGGDGQGGDEEGGNSGTKGKREHGGKEWNGSEANRVDSGTSAGNLYLCRAIALADIILSE
jgi:hypothetical protein